MDSKLIEREKMLNSIISELHNNMDFQGAMNVLLRKLKELSLCSCIGIRLENDGDYPYYVYDGFPEMFILKESNLCSKDDEGNRIKEITADEYCLDCMCGNILRSRYDSSLEFFTEGGSFWSNNTSKLLATTTEDDRQANTRNYCNSCGYESVALVPIKSNGKNIGLIQLNDKRKEMFTKDLIGFIEIIGQVVGIIIANRLIISKLELSEKARKESDDANLQKSMFLSNMSHEIRTPMNGIIGMTQLLEETNLTEEQRVMVDIVKLSSNLLLNIINNILDLSKMEAGKYKLSEDNFSIYELLKEVIGINKVIADKKGIIIKTMMDLEVPQNLIGDETRIKQVLVNIIGNAIKFTQKGYVEINVTRTKVFENAVQLTFDIIDTGIGISEENISKLFKTFTQLDDSNTKTYQGTGLGLAISKQLIDLMNGSIHVTSKLGEGSRFSISIILKTNKTVSPVANVRKDEIKQSIITNPDQEVKILLIEDDYVNQKIIEKFLLDSNIKLMVAKDAKEGFEWLDKMAFDLLLLDIQLPDVSGYEIAREIRKREKGLEHMPIIATTAYALSGDREKCIDSGIDGYIPKPINFKLLTNLINKYLEKI